MKVLKFMNKATKLSDVRAICQYYPLDTDELTKFYIDTTDARGEDVLKKFELDFAYIPDVYQQVLFLGHIGTGKSTLLYQFERKFSSIYRIIRFSVQNYLDVEKMTLIDLLCVMYERILTICSEDLPEDDTELKQAYDRWYATTKLELEREQDFDLEVSGDVQFGFKSKLIKLLSKLTSTLRVGSKDRTTICSVIEKNINDYIDLLNRLVSIIKRKNDKPILIIFEDLEKIPQKNADDIFVQKGTYFNQIKLHLLLTTPIYLKYHTLFRNYVSQRFSYTEKCPIIPVSYVNNSDYNIGIKTLKDIVYARVSKDLIDDDALGLAVSYSGGVIRDLLWLIGESSVICTTGRISVDDINHAFITLQNLYGESLRENQVDTIRKVYNDPYALVADDNELELMRAEIIIEYGTGFYEKTWRGVHPAVSRYLIDRNKLKEKNKTIDNCSVSGEV